MSRQQRRILTPVTICDLCDKEMYVNDLPMDVDTDRKMYYHGNGVDAHKICIDSELKNIIEVRKTKASK